MFGLGFSEILLCLVIALIVFGPDKLPELARMLGRTIGELRRTLDEIKFEVNAPVNEIKREIRSVMNDTSPEVVKNQPPAIEQKIEQPAEIKSESTNSDKTCGK